MVQIDNNTQKVLKSLEEYMLQTVLLSVKGPKNSLTFKDRVPPFNLMPALM